MHTSDTRDKVSELLTLVRYMKTIERFSFMPSLMTIENNLGLREVRLLRIVTRFFVTIYLIVHPINENIYLNAYDLILDT